MPGFAVVAVRTTGLLPRSTDRATEVAVVQTTTDGEVQRVWSTLLDPGPDAAGPAPRFADVAGPLAQLCAGRVLVAHDAPFVMPFVQAEFDAAGFDAPVESSPTLCTMHLASTFFPDAPRTLTGCCEYFGIRQDPTRTAESDALAASAVLRRVTGWASSSHLWDDDVAAAELVPWPPVAAVEVVPVPSHAQPVEPSFLSRLADRLPSRPDPAVHQAYLGILDTSLLERRLKATRESLLAAAHGLGIDRDRAQTLHRTYLVDLSIAAMADDDLSPAHRADLDQVAQLLGLASSDVDAALAAGAWAATRRAPVEAGPPSWALPSGTLAAAHGGL
jgi:DNA polymerase III subunit epsilon